MNGFQQKSVTVSRGYHYTYYVADGDKALPPLVLQHGWPDHAKMWEGVASSLRSLKHPIVIPDLLGYGGTDKPTDTTAYKWDGMTQDVLDILSNEGHDKFISVGHDWGSGLASRMYNYHPARVVGVILMNVGYSGPQQKPFDLDALNQMLKQVFGFALLEYWNVFTAPDGAKVLKENVERLYEIMHGQGDTLRDFCCVAGALRDQLENGSHKIQVRPYAQDQEFKQEFLDRMKRDGFEGPQNWYKATKENIQFPLDAALPEENCKVNVPMLFIACKQDPLCVPATMAEAKMKGWLPQLEEAEPIDSAHWCAYEKPDEVVDRMSGWLQSHYGASK